MLKWIVCFNVHQINGKNTHGVRIGVYVKQEYIPCTTPIVHSHGVHILICEAPLIQFVSENKSNKIV